MKPLPPPFDAAPRITPEELTALLRACPSWRQRAVLFFCWWMSEVFR